MSYWNGRHGEGAMKARREEKREEAKSRNWVTPHVRTRQHRESRCTNCPMPAAVAR